MDRHLPGQALVLGIGRRHGDLLGAYGHALQVAVGVRLAHQILTRLRFSNEEMEQVEALVAHHMRFIDLPHMRQSTMKRFLRIPDFAEHLELHRLDATGSNQRLDNYHLVRKKLEEFTAEHLRPEPLVTGAILIAMGYQPGPQFSLMLHALEDAQLEGRIHTQEEAMDLVRELFPREN